MSRMQDIPQDVRVRTPKINVKKIKRDRKTLPHLKKEKKKKN